MNVRFSYNIDPEPRSEPLDQPHYTFGFNLVGLQPYPYPDMNYTNPRRRPPQTVVRIPSTGALTWLCTIRRSRPDSPGMRPGPCSAGKDSSGFMNGSTCRTRAVPPCAGTCGGSIHRNRRTSENCTTPTWTSVIICRAPRKDGSKWAILVNQQKDLEFRYFDSDGDGYLDTIKVFAGTDPAPVRTSHVTDVRARPVTLARAEMQADYNNRVLPLAIKQNQQLIGALKQTVNVPLAAAYETEAAKATSAERQRYCLDIARELYFLKARDEFYSRNAAGPYPQLNPAKGGTRIRTAGPVEGGYTLGDTLSYSGRTPRRLRSLLKTTAPGVWKKPRSRR